MIRLCAVLVLLCFWMGCGHVGGAPEGTNRQSAYQYYDAARMQHDLHNYEQALVYLQTARALDPQNPIFTQTHQDMLIYYDAMATDHFEQGLEAARSGNLELARTQWMTALRYNPNYAAALEKLYGEAPAQHVYHIQKGDTPEKVAKRVYGHQSWSTFVAFLYPSGPQGHYPEGTSLILPRVETTLEKNKAFAKAKTKAKAKAKADTKPASPVTRPANPVTALKKAQEENGLTDSAVTSERPPSIDSLLTLFQKAQYVSVIQQALQLPAEESDTDEVRDLVSRARYQEAQKLLKAGKLIDAQSMLAQMPPPDENQQAAKWEALRGDLERAIQHRAQHHFKLGLDHYVHERLREAIEEWQTVLVYRPQHPQARMGIQNAQRLIDALKKIK